VKQILRMTVSFALRIPGCCLGISCRPTVRRGAQGLLWRALKGIRAAVFKDVDGVAGLE